MYKRPLILYLFVMWNLLQDAFRRKPSDCYPVGSASLSCVVLCTRDHEIVLAAALSSYIIG